MKCGFNVRFYLTHEIDGVMLKDSVLYCYNITVYNQHINMRLILGANVMATSWPTVTV